MGYNLEDRIDQYEQHQADSLKAVNEEAAKLLAEKEAEAKIQPFRQTSGSQEDLLFHDDGTRLTVNEIYDSLDLVSAFNPGPGFQDWSEDPDYDRASGVYYGHRYNRDGGRKLEGGAQGYSVGYAPYYATGNAMISGGLYSNNAVIEDPVYQEKRGAVDPQTNKNIGKTGYNLHDEFSAHATTSPYVLLSGDKNPYLTGYDDYLKGAWDEHLKWIESTGREAWFNKTRGVYGGYSTLGGLIPHSGYTEHHPLWNLSENGYLSKTELLDIMDEAEAAGEAALKSRIKVILSDPKKYESDYIQLLDLLDPDTGFHKQRSTDLDFGI